MSCLQNLVTINDLCGRDTSESLSGYDLMKAPEITTLSLSDTSNEKYISGYKLAKAVLENTLLDFKNDFLFVLSANNISTNVSRILYQSSEFNLSNTWPPVNKERGLTYYKAPKSKNKIKKSTITKVSILPLIDKEDAEVLIYDCGSLYTYPVSLTGGMINTIEINHVVQGDFARVLVSGVDLPVASSMLTCFTGCGGKLPNDCGYVKGYNGDTEISNKEGFGIGIEFTCECDYEAILCELAKSYVGKLIFLKARIGLLDERISSNRLSNLVIYGIDEAKDKKKELELEYAESWNAFVASLPNLLKKYNTDCLNCVGIKWVTNI